MKSKIDWELKLAIERLVFSIVGLLVCGGVVYCVLLSLK